MEISVAKTSREDPEPEAMSLMGNNASLSGAEAPSSILGKGSVSPELSIQTGTRQGREARERVMEAL